MRALDPVVQEFGLEVRQGTGSLGDDQTVLVLCSP